MKEQQKNKSQNEVRSLNVNSELKSEQRRVYGYAAVFNSPSNPIQGQGGFTEIIKPNAFDGVIKRSDVLALLDHQRVRGVLARSKFGEGTLTLSIDQRGLRFDFESPKTDLGNEVIEGVDRGDISTASFAFSLLPGGDSWTRNNDGSYVRTINKVDKIFDVSPTYIEAYSDTSVAVRGLAEFRSQEEEGEGEGEKGKKDKVITPLQKAETDKPSLDELARHYEILEDKMKTY